MLPLMLPLDDSPANNRTGSLALQGISAVTRAVVTIRSITVTY